MGADSGEIVKAPEGVADEGDTIAVAGEAAGSAGLASWKVAARATGLYGGAGAAGHRAGMRVLTFGPDPWHPKHSVLSLFIAFVCGLFTNAAVGNARIRDALKEKDNYRAEVQRMAQDQRKLFSSILKKQLSSSNPPPPKS